MLHKLACLMVCASSPLILAPFAHANPSFGHSGPDSVPGTVMARVQPPGEMPLRWEGLPHAVGLSAGPSDVRLSDTERLQLREQIRAATRDLYPDIYQNGAASVVPVEILAPTSSDRRER